AEDGIRDKLVTGVQTCALPISQPSGNFSGMIFLPAFAKKRIGLRRIDIERITVRLEKCDGLSTRPPSPWRPIKTFDDAERRVHCLPHITRGPCHSRNAVGVRENCIAYRRL